MTQLAVPPTTLVTFVVRFWRETAAGEIRWRGQIEHVQSGKRIQFLGVHGLLPSLRRFGIDTNFAHFADRDGRREVDASRTDAL